MSEILTAFKYYTDPNGGIHAFAIDGSQDAYIGPDLVPGDMDVLRDILVPPFNLERDQERLKYEVSMIYVSAMRKLNIEYPAQERETWPIQLAEAKDLIENGESAVTPFIDALVEGREITRLEVATKILEKDAEYKVKAGKLTGVKQDHHKAIESITLLPKKSGQAACAACAAYDVSSNWPDFSGQN